MGTRPLARTAASPATRTGTRVAVLAVVLVAVLASGCDGGIFGTGDGSPGVVGTDAGPPSSLTGPGDGGSPGVSGPESADTGDDLPPVDASTETPGGDRPPGVDPEPASLPLSNLFAADPSTRAPRLRVVNAGGTDVALAGDARAPARVAVPAVAPGSVSAYVSVPDGVATLSLGYPVLPDGLPPFEGERLLGPLTLVPSSVTTLLVRDGQLPLPEIVALPTEVTSGDPVLARVRLLPGSGIGPGDGPLPAERYTLVPDGANPGGVQVELGSVALGGPADAAYATVPAGDYRLESSAPGVTARALSFPGGAVRTLVLLAPDELLVVVDGG